MAIDNSNPFGFISGVTHEMPVLFDADCIERSFKGKMWESLQFGKNFTHFSF